VPLPLESTTSHVPTIGVTAAGLPRIYAASDDGSSQGFHYLSCDEDCETAESWQDLRVSNTYPLPEPVALPKLPFAVSPDGAAAFVTSDNSTMTAAYCSESCSDGASWSQVTLGGAYTYPESVVFGAGGGVQITGRRQSNAGESLFWLSCTTNCGDSASWSGLDGLLSVPDHVESAVAATGAGGTRIAAYLDDPTTNEVDHQFALLFCDSDCLSADNWSLLWPLPMPAESANVGLAFALDAEDRPVVAYVSDLGSGYAKCSGNCTSTSGQWEAVATIGVDGLNASVPPTVPASCLSASWLMYTGPAFTLDARGEPLLGVTARAQALGGECGSGSMATTTGSFLALPP
jgi:hypothetical protein